MTHEHEEPALFDLPLSPPPASGESGHEEPAPRRSRARAPRPESLPLFGDEELAAMEPQAPAREPRATRREYERMPSAEAAQASRPVAVPRVVAEPQPEAANAAGTAPLGSRLRAGLGDLTVLAAVGAVAAVGARFLGGALDPSTLPALATFLLSFSFLYCVVSLAFWGQTPGMAWTGLVARSDETEPLSFGQTALRWLGHWLTWLLLGLPALLAAFGGSGRSLADRLSGSETYEV